MSKFATQLRNEIESELGFFPPYFEPGLNDATMLEQLWCHTRTFHAEKLMPIALQERIAISASRYSPSGHRLLAYVITTRNLQLSAKAMLELLQSLPDSQASFSPDDACIMTLSIPSFGWPQPGSRQAEALVRCATAIFTHSKSDEAAEALKKFLSPSHFLHLVGFIAYLQASLAWTEAFPEISFERDPGVAARVAGLIAAQPRLMPYLMPASLPSTAALDIPLVLNPARDQPDADRSAEHFECAKSGLNLGVWSSLAPFDQVTWNQRIRELFFVDSNEIITSDTFFRSLHPDDRERVKNLIDQSLGGKIMFDAEMRAVNPKNPNQVRWIHSLAWISYDVSNRPIRLDGVAVDLTTSREIDRLKQVQGERLHALLDALPVMAWLYDGNSKERWMSKRWHNFTGVNAVSENSYEPIHPLDRERVMKMREGMQPESDSRIVFYRLLGACGRYRWVKEQSRALIDPTGTYVHTVGTVVDAEAAQAKATLRSGSGLFKRESETKKYSRPASEVRLNSHTMQDGLESTS